MTYLKQQSSAVAEDNNSLRENSEVVGSSVGVRHSPEVSHDRATSNGSIIQNCAHWKLAQYARAHTHILEAVVSYRTKAISTISETKIASATWESSPV
eukprot:COSAG05_NODE_9_length_39734_cov_180.598067_24_plen_98_part_00